MEQQKKTNNNKVNDSDAISSILNNKNDNVVYDIDKNKMIHIHKKQKSEINRFKNNMITTDYIDIIIQKKIKELRDESFDTDTMLQNTMECYYTIVQNLSSELINELQ